MQLFLLPVFKAWAKLIPEPWEDNRLIVSTTLTESKKKYIRLTQEIFLKFFFLFFFLFFVFLIELQLHLQHLTTYIYYFYCNYLHFTSHYILHDYNYYNY